MAASHKSSGSIDEARSADPFRHQALFYAGEEDFVRRVGAFVRDGLDRREPVLVAVSPRKIDMLCDHLGGAARDVVFADMDELGRNPGRIIPVWMDFLHEAGADRGALRGVGEPISAARTPEELVEAERHEALLNVAFDASHPLWLVCPYDTSALGESILAEARRNHPLIEVSVDAEPSPTYPGLEAFAKPFDAPLPEPAVPTKAIEIAIDKLDAIRQTIATEAHHFGLNETRTADLVLCVNEIATNSILHGGGAGELRLWKTQDGLVCEVRDAGRIQDPLAGRARPVLGDASGYGLWLSNQLCDLVQLRTLPTGTVVRLTMRHY